MSHTRLFAVHSESKGLANPRVRAYEKGINSACVGLHDETHRLRRAHILHAQLLFLALRLQVRGALTQSVVVRWFLYVCLRVECMRTFTG